MEQKRYWRPHTEQILEEIEKARRMEVTTQMIQPIVIPMTELDEKIQEQIIKRVDFTKGYTQMTSIADKKHIDFLMQTAKDMCGMMKLTKEMYELRKIIDEYMNGIYKICEVKIDETDLRQIEILLYLKTINEKSLILREPFYKNEE